MGWMVRALPAALPLIVWWAAYEEARILRDGVPLAGMQLDDALAMGVREPQRVRLLRVAKIPTNPFHRRICTLLRIPAEMTIGLTLRYGIYIRSDYWLDRRLLAHECAHTAQYERLGGHRTFLAQYLRECLELGYLNSPLEQEAMHKSCAL